MDCNHLKRFYIRVNVSYSVSEKCGHYFSWETPLRKRLKRAEKLTKLFWTFACAENFV